MTSPVVSVLADPERVLAVRDSGLMDTPPEDSFDRLTRLTCKTIRTPAAMLSLLDADRQYIKSGVGLSEPWAPGRSVPVDQSFCRHVVESGQPLVVEDARSREGVHLPSPVRGLSLIAYAGVPVRVGGGHVLGSLCAIDYMPRPWVAEELDVLAELAAVVARDIDLRITEHRTVQSAGGAASGDGYIRSLIEGAWGVVYVTDAAGVIREVSRTTESLLGYAPQEMIGRREAEFICPDDFGRIEEALEQDIRSSVPSPPHDVRLRRRDGSWCTVEATRKLLTGESGALVVVVNGRDVTERRQAEEALRRSEERFQLAARATNDVIWEWDLATGAMQWCPDAHKAFRYARDEIGSAVEWWYERIHQDDRERVIGSIQQAINGVGDFWSEEYRFRRGDGSYATVLDRAYVARDERKVPERMVGSMVDVTERRRAEDAQRLLSRASAALDSSLDCDTILAALARVVVPTLADVCVIHVLEDDGTLRRGAGAYAHPEKGTVPAGDERFPTNAEVPGPATLRAVRTRRPVLVGRHAESQPPRAAAADATAKAAPGSLVLRSLIAVPLVSHERVLGTITVGTADSGRQYTPADLVVAEDLARRTAVALENCLLYARSEQAVRARDAVLGVVSHDLRNPLNTILMSASLLLDRAEERRAENVRGLEIIKRSVQQMNAMIRDLLDASSIDAGRFRVARSHRDVTALLAEARELLEPLADAKAIHLDCEAADGLPQLWVDSDQILRVFSNLVGNAIKFTPDRGAIRVRADRSDDRVIFSVSDTGPGIPADQIPHVFDRYWQGMPGDRRGAGLGLAIAKGIVEAHGGRIWVESRPGGGTTFRFSVPLERACAGPPGPPLPGAQLAPAKRAPAPQFAAAS